MVRNLTPNSRGTLFRSESSGSNTPNALHGHATVTGGRGGVVGTMGKLVGRIGDDVIGGGAIGGTVLNITSTQ